MAGEHVREQAHAVRDRTRQEREHLDDHDERQDVDRHAARHEQLEKAQPVRPEAVDDHREEHQQRQRGGDDDVARHREGIRQQADQVHEQNEHEERKDEREEFAAAMPDIGVDHVSDKLVAHLGERLPTAGDESALARAEDEECGDQHHDDGHQQGRVGVRNVKPTDVDWNEPLDLKLLERVDLYRQFNSPRRPSVLNRRRSPGACHTLPPR